MKVTIEYHDTEALTVEEIVSNAVAYHGKGVQVSVMPESTMAYDLIYFGIQQLITHEQLSMLYDRDSSYQQEVKSLRNDVIYKIKEIIDQVIIDNEAKVS